MDIGGRTDQLEGGNDRGRNGHVEGKLGLEEDIVVAAKSCIK